MRGESWQWTSRIICGRAVSNRVDQPLSRWKHCRVAQRMRRQTKFGTCRRQPQPQGPVMPVEVGIHMELLRLSRYVFWTHIP
jgi:hypothetical protein